MIPGGWFINLDRSTDRRARMEAECARLPFPVARFRAFEPATIPPGIAARFPADTALTPGGRACLASHLGVLELIAASPHGYYLVLEDDVRLHGDFASIADDLAAWPVGPEVIRLENPLKCPAIRVRAGARHSYVRPLHIPNSSAGYLATPAGARRILDLAWNLDIVADQFLRAVGRADVDMLVCSPPPLSPIDLDTTIGASRAVAGRRRPTYRGSGFSLGRELRFIGRFGPVDFARLTRGHAMMALNGVRIDVEARYVFDPAKRAT